MINSSELCETFDPLAGMGDEGDCDDWLVEQRWMKWLPIGGTDMTAIIPWFRENEGAGIEWMIEIHDTYQGRPFYVKVRDLPTVMDLLARWGQVAVIDGVTELLTGLNELGLDQGNATVETLAARVAWGVKEMLPRMERQHAKNQEIYRRLREERRKKREAEEARVKEALQPAPVMQAFPSNH